MSDINRQVIYNTLWAEVETKEGKAPEGIYTIKEVSGLTWPQYQTSSQ